MKRNIVYMGDIVNDENSSLLQCKNLLQQVSSSYQVPKLEADKMAGFDEAVSVFADKNRHLLTTKSWDFIGFPEHVKKEKCESDIIIGIIDSGIWPESESFNDEGFSPPPAKWKGICQFSDFVCNKKIIGTRYINFHGSWSKKDLKSPRDSVGHGTHTASIAAGNPVDMASMVGLAKGVARGGAPSARIAVYKVCWTRGCSAVDILTAFELAIEDIVDILSVSIGGELSARGSYFLNSLSIGSFNAMQHGVLTVFAAGNGGLNSKSLHNVQPWAIVVAASTLNRKFVTMVRLGDNKVYKGISLNSFDLRGKLYPIIYGGDVPNTRAGVDRHKSKFCLSNTLDHKLVKGAFLLCEGSGGAAVGAVGLLIKSDDFNDMTFSHSLPACSLQPVDVANILKYMRSTRSPSATIYRTSELTDDLAPPDLSAPGVNIIARWPSNTPVSLDDNRTMTFNIMSGTSMACPHMAGAAAYVKSFYPH